MADLRGQRFGPYVVLERIARGGMAEIFLAKRHGHAGFEKLCVLKKIRPRYAQKKVLRRLLIHEAKLAAKLVHLNVVQVYDLGEIDGIVYLAMEYVRGRDLAAVLTHAAARRERVPLDIGLFVVTELMSGLVYAHGFHDDAGETLGIVHRDVSPHNILISYEGEVKVTDFGIARARIEGAVEQNLRGKFGYMSPEQVNDIEVDQRADVFSAGVVLWELLAGQRLFHTNSPDEAMQRILRAEISPPSKHNPSVPRALDKVVLKALRRNRDERTSSMRNLRGQLYQIIDALPHRAGTRELAVYMRRQFGRVGGYQPGLPTPMYAFVPTKLATAPNTKGALGQMLIELGVTSDEDVEIALAEQRAGGGRIGELMIASGTITEEDLAVALARQSKREWLSESALLGVSPPKELLERFPRGEAEDMLVVPIGVGEKGRAVNVAIPDPYDEARLQEARVVLGVTEIVPHIATRSAIRAAIDAWYVDALEVPEPTLSPVPAGPQVLIADADLTTIMPLLEQLRAEDCDFVTATTGRDARALIASRPPVVALLDVNLPGIDGVNLCLDLVGRHPNAEVFLTQANPDDDQQRRALAVGAADLFEKPLSVAVVSSKIRRALRRHERDGGEARALRFEGVSGSLREMTALDVFQSLEVGLKTAHVVLQYDDGRRGEVGVAQGRIVAAATATSTGDVAFFELVPPGAGLFRIEYRPTSLGHTIDSPNTELMLRAFSLLDPKTPPMSAMTEDLVLSPTPE